MCFDPYLGFGVSLISRTGFYVVVIHAARWEPFGHYHPRFSCGDPFFVLRDCVYVFPYQFVARAYVFPSVFWGLVQVSLTHRLGDCIFFPSVVCVSFPGDFVVQDRLLFSPCHELCLLIHLGLL